MNHRIWLHDLQSWVEAVEGVDKQENKRKADNHVKNDLINKVVSITWKSTWSNFLLKKKLL
jgi:hypothetical protein